MDYGINREEALTLLKENVRNENLIKHCLATEAVMKALAEELGEDKEKWKSLKGKGKTTSNTVYRALK